jgi:hypothetical protein
MEDKRMTFLDNLVKLTRKGQAQNKEAQAAKINSLLDEFLEGVELAAEGGGTDHVVSFNPYEYADGVLIELARMIGVETGLHVNCKLYKSANKVVMSVSWKDHL